MKTIYFIIACIGTLLPLATSAQTFTSVDINPGADSSNPIGFTEYNNKLYFTANDGVHGSELWVSDGTQGGSHMVSDIWPGAGSSNIGHLIVYNNKLYFNADDSVHGDELWVTDGTAGGTSLVADIWPGTGPGGPYDFATLNGKLYFTADDSTHGYELWVTDGTTGGTAMVADINPGISSSGPGVNSFFYSYNNKLYFNANDGVHGCELWVTDGTVGGTSMVKDIFPGTNNSYAGYTYTGFSGPHNGFVTLNNKMYFGAQDSIHGWELWTSDGTTAGTTLVDDIFTGTGKSYTGYYGGFFVINGKIYFSANDSIHGYELWTSDGTTGGTLMVKDINPGSANSYPMYYSAAVFNGQLFFCAAANGTDFQLYSSDGTTAGTNAVSNIYTSYSFYDLHLTAFNNSLFTEGDDSTQQFNLYNINTADSLMLLAPPVAPNIGPLNAQGALYPFNGSLAFAASFNSIGNELWFYTPVPAAIASVQTLTGINIYPNPFTSQISLTGLQNGVEYHLTLTDIQGREIEQYQLTGAGATNTIYMSGNLASGMYLLQLSNGEAIETVKIVKE